MDTALANIMTYTLFHVPHFFTYFPASLIPGEKITHALYEQEKKGFFPMKTKSKILKRRICSVVSFLNTNNNNKFSVRFHEGFLDLPLVWVWWRGAQADMESGSHSLSFSCIYKSYYSWPHTMTWATLSLDWPHWAISRPRSFGQDLAEWMEEDASFVAKWMAHIFHLCLCRWQSCAPCGAQLCNRCQRHWARARAQDEVRPSWWAWAWVRLADMCSTWIISYGRLHQGSGG